MLNLMMLFGPNNLRNISIQTKHIDIHDKEANRQRCFPVNSLANDFQRAGYPINETLLDQVDPPLAIEMGEWHHSGKSPTTLGFKAFALYLIGAYKEDNETLSQWGMFDCDVHKHEKDATGREERLAKISAVLTDSGIPFYWSWSRSGGIHIWIFFSKPLLIPATIKRLQIIKKLLFDKGVFTPDEGPKVEIRPDGSGGRILLPNNQIYPISVLCSKDGEPLTTTDVERLSAGWTLSNKSNDDKPTRASNKSESEPERKVTLEAFGKKTYAPRLEQMLPDTQFATDLSQSFRFESGVKFDDLSPCIRHMLVNKLPVPDGQWDRTCLAVAQMIGAALKGEHQDKALEQLSEVMNILGEYGNYPPEKIAFFEKKVTAAYAGFNKGMCIGCNALGGQMEMRKHCHPRGCSPIYKKVQDVKQEEKPRVLQLQQMDPFSRKEGLISLIFISLLKDDPLIPTDKLLWYEEKNWLHLQVEINPRAFNSSNSLQAVLMSATKTNTEHYDFSLLMDIPKKDFNEVINKLVFNSKKEIVYNVKYEPAYIETFQLYLNRQTVAIVKGNASPYELKSGIEDGQRVIYFPRTFLEMVTRHMMARRAADLKTTEVMEYYAKYCLKAKKISEEIWTLPYETVKAYAPDLINQLEKQLAKQAADSDPKKVIPWDRHKM